MVPLCQIFPGGGDQGRTSLGDGTRVAKHAGRVAAYGTVDEANAAIGLARLHTTGEPDAMLARIQNDLFDLGADLCRPGEVADGKALRVGETQVERLEKEVDALNAALRPLDSFVLPGGSRAAASLPPARPIPRRSERLVCELAETEAVNSAAIRYLNRLSDHLFVLSRWVNDKGVAD